MVLNSVRIFNLEDNETVDLSNVTVVDDILYQDNEKVVFDNFEEVSLKSKSFVISALDLETAHALTAPKKRGKATISDEVIAIAKRRIMNGDKLSEISFDLRISSAYLAKIKKGQARVDVEPAPIEQVEQVEVEVEEVTEVVDQVDQAA